MDVKISKVKINIDPELMKNIFRIAEYRYSLRTETKYKFHNFRTITYEKETDFSVGPTVILIIL